MISLRAPIAVLVALAALMGPWAAPLRAQTENIWVMWESLPPLPTDPPEYRSHLLFNVPRSTAEDFFYSLIPAARRYGNANVVHEVSPLCLARGAEPSTPPREAATRIDESSREIADKLATLRGLEGVFADLRGVIGPPGYRSNFGQDSHAFLMKAFADAGIPLLTREQIEEAPGRPQLKLRYSIEVVGCKPWAVYLSLVQTVVLTRDTRIMIETTTWSASARQSEEDIGYGPYDAVEDVIRLFVADYLEANGADPEQVANLRH